jgi:hypothetical protein
MGQWALASGPVRSSGLTVVEVREGDSREALPDLTFDLRQRTFLGW